MPSAQKETELIMMSLMIVLLDVDEMDMSTGGAVVSTEVGLFFLAVQRGNMLMKQSQVTVI